MAIAPERQRKADYERWRKARDKRLRSQGATSSKSMCSKRLANIDWFNFDDEEHF